jgi:hypothetical protein
MRVPRTLDVARSAGARFQDDDTPVAVGRLPGLRSRRSSFVTSLAASARFRPPLGAVAHVLAREAHVTSPGRA